MLSPGTRLGPYEIRSVLGSGGMGTVYKALDRRLDRVVAIKLLSPAVAADPALRDRLDHEARAISRLKHPHICTLYDVGEAETEPGQSVSYLVLEFVEGESLEQRLAHGPLPIDQALTFAVQIADAMNAAHRAGIVHGDLKPGNIIVSASGLKLLDFGLARQSAGTIRERPDTVTRPASIAGPGIVLGTLQYLAPEQLEGREPDERTDIFACGAVIYEMLTGRKAFAGDTPAAVVAAIMQQPPPPVTAAQPDAPFVLDHIVATCLARNPDERWQHAADLMRELKWAASGASVLPAPGRRRRDVWRMATAVLAILLAAVIAGALYLRPQPSSAPAYRTSVVLPEGLRFPLPGAFGGVGRFALSPDGRRIAFVATDPRGDQLLWVRSLDSLTAQPLAGTNGAFSPFWSPDSRRVAFIAQGQLKIIDPAGGMPAVVFSPAFNTTGAWSRDNTILFTPTAASPLHRVALSGGASTPVTALDTAGGEVLHRNPILLPDGRHVVYTSVGPREGGTTGARAVYVAPLDGSDPPRVLIAAATTARYAQGHLIFLRDNALLAQPLDLGSLTLSGEPRLIAEQVALIGPSSAAFSVSDTGVLAYQGASGRGSQLVWVDRSGRELETVADPADYGDLELSPDGQRAVVSVLDAARNTRDLWVIDLARGVRTRLTSDAADEVAPVWSPDGARIAFASNRRGHFDLYEKSASGVGAETMLMQDDAEKYPTSWSSDGTTVLYWQYDADGTSLLTLSLGDEASPRVFLEGPVSQGKLSPDGRWVVYDSPQSGRSEVYVVPFPEPTRRWQVSTAGGNLSRWRPDGGEVLYAARDNTLMAASVLNSGADLAIGPARPLFDARAVGPRAFFAPSADGQRFLLNVLRGDSLSTSITLLQNWHHAAAP